MEIFSQRLLLKPLNKKELELYIDSREGFERDKNLKVSGVTLNEDCCEELREIISSNPSVWACSDGYLLNTLWLLIDRELKSIIGQFWFNGKPNTNGEVEMFFSIEKAYRKQGYSIESVSKLIEWAKEHKPFRVLSVEVSDHNNAALASLKKLGFKKFDNDPETSKLLDDLESTAESPSFSKYYFVVYSNEIEDISDFEV